MTCDQIHLKCVSVRIVQITLEQTRHYKAVHPQISQDVILVRWTMLVHGCPMTCPGHIMFHVEHIRPPYQQKEAPFAKGFLGCTSLSKQQGVIVVQHLPRLERIEREEIIITGAVPVLQDELVLFDAVEVRLELHQVL